MAREGGAPTNVGYTLLLMAHVVSAVVGFGSLCLTGIQAVRARGGPQGPRAAGVRRYFRSGTNWPARALYLVPVFGFALLADSAGAFDSSDTFVVVGLGIWLLATLLAEAVVWPAERRIQKTVSGDWRADEVFSRECLRVGACAWVLAVMFVAAVVVMIGKP